MNAGTGNLSYSGRSSIVSQPRRLRVLRKLMGPVKVRPSQKGKISLDALRGEQIFRFVKWSIEAQMAVQGADARPREPRQMDIPTPKTSSDRVAPLNARPTRPSG